MQRQRVAAASLSLLEEPRRTQCPCNGSSLDPGSGSPRCLHGASALAVPAGPLGLAPGPGGEVWGRPVGVPGHGAVPGVGTPGPGPQLVQFQLDPLQLCYQLVLEEGGGRGTQRLAKNRTHAKNAQNAQNV